MIDERAVRCAVSVARATARGRSTSELREVGEFVRKRAKGIQTRDCGSKKDTGPKDGIEPLREKLHEVCGQKIPASVCAKSVSEDTTLFKDSTHLLIHVSSTSPPPIIQFDAQIVANSRDEQGIVARDNSTGERPIKLRIDNLRGNKPRLQTAATR